MSNTTYRVLVEKLGASNPEQFIGNEGDVFYDPTGTVLRLSDGVTPGGVILSGSTPTGEWIRPTDWLEMPEVANTDEKFTGLFAVYNTPENFIALQFEGDYTVDWGDGLVEDFNSGVIAEHSYDWSDIPSNTLTEYGYRQVIVTVTPQTGQELTYINLGVRNANIIVSGSTTPWLDIIFSLPNLDSGQSIILSNNGTDEYLGNIQRISILNSGNATDFTQLLYYAVSLKTFNLGINSVTDMTSMFAECTSLEIVSISNASSVTTMYSMFESCYALTTVSLFDTSSVTDMSDMFYDCTSLTTVPLFDTSSVTDMSSMFESCYALTTVPLFDTSSVTDMTYMFYGCTSLTTVPLFDTSSVTSMYGMFDSCYALTTVPLFDTSSVTSMYGMFETCYALITVPLFDTSSVTDMSGMFNGCYALTTVPLFDTSSVTDMTYMFNSCQSLQVGALNNTQVSVSYASCLLNRDEIVSIFNNLGTVVGETIDISSNYGVGDLTLADYEIATNKGWTVTN